MIFLVSVLFIILLLFLIVIIGSLQQFSIFLVTKKKIEFYQVILPALLSIIVFMIIYIISTLLFKVYNISILDMILYNVMKWNYEFTNIILIIFVCLVCFIAFIFLQAMCIKLIYLDYDKAWKKVKIFLFKKIFKKDISLDVNDSNKTYEDLPNNVSSISLSCYPDKNSINLLNCILSSLLTFSISFFAIFLLLFIGDLIGIEYINKK